ncbi:MAG: hypothetical protein ACE3JP_13535 [Ectobacillus sp.]
MACEEEKEKYESAMDSFISDWDDFNDADNNLENAAYDFWLATAVTWAAAFSTIEGPIGELIGLAQMIASEEKFNDAKEVYEREWKDLLEGFDEFQEASEDFCRCYDREL